MLDPKQWNVELVSLESTLHKLEDDLRVNRILDAYDRVKRLLHQIERLRDLNSQ